MVLLIKSRWWLQVYQSPGQREAWALAWLEWSHHVYNGLRADSFSPNNCFICPCVKPHSEHILAIPLSLTQYFLLISSHHVGVWSLWGQYVAMYLSPHIWSNLMMLLSLSVLPVDNYHSSLVCPPLAWTLPTCGRYSCYIFHAFSLQVWLPSVYLMIPTLASCRGFHWSGLLPYHFLSMPKFFKLSACQLCEPLPLEMSGPGLWPILPEPMALSWYQSP